MVGYMNPFLLREGLLCTPVILGLMAFVLCIKEIKRPFFSLSLLSMIGFHSFDFY